MDQDWEVVSASKYKKRAPAKEQNTEQNVNHARQLGLEVETEKKFNASTNKNHAPPANARKLEQETEELHHDRVPLSVAQAIQKARNAAKLTQKELATKINEKPGVINDYEAGKAIPDNQVLGKLEKALGVKLRGKDIGQPLAQKPHPQAHPK
eukprot:TRINITY_DN22_c0_g1_i1.p1 TRINITY_DN22_c0_g1~~TRINITY_DN22_c0_g1_i1.p1  ORF type:complete len:173 (-),score=56.61 TRINITY_DN22_c0_g1_i1:88-546(-)